MEQQNFDQIGVFDARDASTRVIIQTDLLPLNAWRAILMLRLIRRVEAASKRDLSTERLKPFMKEASLKAGETIFNKRRLRGSSLRRNND